MAFVSVQQETLLTDIIKTWINHFTSTGNFAGVNFRVDTPDTDIDLKLPLVVLKRVSNDTWSINRNAGYFGINGGDANNQTTLYGYTYNSLVQFDIMCTTISECNKIQGFIYKALQPSGFGGHTNIPIRTYVGIDTVGKSTDLKMKFYFGKDIDGATLPSFDPNLHQSSVSVNFSIDCLSEVSNPKILDTSIVYNIN